MPSERPEPSDIPELTARLAPLIGGQVHLFARGRDLWRPTKRAGSRSGRQFRLLQHRLHRVLGSLHMCRHLSHRNQFAALPLACRRPSHTSSPHFGHVPAGRTRGCPADNLTRGAFTCPRTPEEGALTNARWLSSSEPINLLYTRNPFARNESPRPGRPTDDMQRPLYGGHLQIRHRLRRKQPPTWLCHPRG